MLEYLEQLVAFVGLDTLTKREHERASIEAAKITARQFTTLVGEDAEEEVGDGAPTAAADEDDDIRQHQQMPALPPHPDLTDPTTKGSL